MHATLSYPNFVDAVGEATDPAEPLFAGDDRRRIEYLPTPREIAAACAAIRAAWTLREKRSRFVGDVPPDGPGGAWLPPVIDTTHLRLASGRGADAAAD